MRTATLTRSREADNGLAARDRALPGLEVVLDAERLTTLLRDALPWAEVLAAEPRYVRYKPGTACLVRCRVVLPGEVVAAYVRLQRPDGHAKLLKQARAPREGGGLGGEAVLLPGLAAALFPWPADRHLAVLGQLTGAASRRELLRGALPDRPGLWDASLVALRWKPERRFVGRLEHGGERALLKAYDADFATARRSAKHLGGAATPRTARRLGRSSRHRLLVLEWVAGASLETSLARTGDPALAAEAGAALAALHALPAPELVARTPAGERERLLRSARTVETLVPAAARDARRVMRRAGERLSDDLAPTVAHGDFSADQVILRGGGAALVDLDAAGLADPARDLGSFRAALLRDAQRDRFGEEVAGAAAEHLLEGYAAAGGRLPERTAIDAWTAGALLHLAPEPFRHRDPDWQERVAGLVATAERTVAR